MRFFVTDACVGCGMCNNLCPDVFDMGGDGTAVALEDHVPGELEESACEAKEMCPVAAIEIVEE